MLKTLRAQILAEYVILITIISLAIVTMLPMIKRSAQKMTKLAADQIGNQTNADQDFNSTQGYLVSSRTDTYSSLQTDEIASYGSTGKAYRHAVVTNTETVTNQGFSKDE